MLDRSEGRVTRGRRGSDLCSVERPSRKWDNDPRLPMRCILGLALTAVVVNAQERVELYTTDNGLPNHSILALLQSKDGYLWLTTYRGILRFDGLNFQVFDGSN